MGIFVEDFFFIIYVESKDSLLMFFFNVYFIVFCSIDVYFRVYQERDLKYLYLWREDVLCCI